MSKSSKDSRRGGNNNAATESKNRKPVLEELDSDDDYGTAYSTGSFDSMSQQDEKLDANVSTTATANNSAADKNDNKKKVYPPEVLESEANITYYEVEFIGMAKIPVSEFIKESKNGQSLNGDGNIVFTLDNGRIKLGRRTNAADFKKLACGNNGTDDKKKKGGNRGLIDETKSNTSLDIVKSIRFEDFHFNYDNQFVITMETVPKFDSEAFYSESQNVSCVVMPGAMKRISSDGLVVLNRPISNRVILFQNQYPGVTLATFEEDIQPARENLSLVHFGSPIIEMINNDGQADTKTGVYSGPSPGLERTNQVLVPTKLVRKYKQKTMEVMKNSISYANVTNGFKITFTAPIPDHRLALNAEWGKTSRQTGMPFYGFGDPYHRSNASIATILNSKPDVNIKEMPDLDISFRCIVQYRKINDEPIPLNI